MTQKYNLHLVMKVTWMIEGNAMVGLLSLDMAIDLYNSCQYLILDQFNSVYNNVI